MSGWSQRSENDTFESVEIQSVSVNKLSQCPSLKNIHNWLVVDFDLINWLKSIMIEKKYWQQHPLNYLCHPPRCLFELIDQMMV